VELVICLTHTKKIDGCLPNIEPTNIKVKMSVVIIVGKKDKKLTHEHIYWDQASVLVQVRFLDSKNLPVEGDQSANKPLKFINT